MKSENLPVFFIDGNHDNANPSWISAISDYSINLDLHPVTLFDNISLSGVKYRSKSDLQETISNMVPTKYVVMHQMAKRVCSFAGVANFDLDWLPDGVEGCFLGDYHLPVEFSNDKVKAWYTGSMHVISIDEEKKKSFIDATPNDKGTLDVARIPLKGREYHSITIKSNKDLDAIIEAGSLKEIKASRGPVGMPVLVVNISTNEEIAGLKERVSSAVTENVYLWYNINTMKRLEDVTDSRDTQNTRMPMIHYIGEFADEKSSVGTLTKRLLEASDDTEADKLIKSYKSSLSI
jgi:DNA repair exonuclease SbcCD nuclease subunit